MADKQSNPTQVILKNVRLSFPRLFKAEASVEGSDPKFSAGFLMDPTTDIGKANYQACARAVKHVSQQEWGDENFYKKIKADRIALANGNDQTNQETGEVYPGYEGQKVVKGTSKKRPQVVDRRRSPVTEEDNLFYGGCRVNAVIRFYAVKGKEKGGNGIFASLEAVQFYRDDEAFGAGPVDPDSVFDDLGDDFGDDGDGGLGDGLDEEEGGLDL